MQTLKVVRKSFKSIGFSPNLEPFSYTILSILFIALSAISVQWVFVFYGTNSSQERVESMYIVSG